MNVISAFYKNNKKQGFGLTLTDNDSSIKNQILQLHKGASAYHDRKEITKGLIEQLETFSKLSNKELNKIDSKIKVMMMANVYTLEKWNAIKIDEYTGMQMLSC